ncbi:MAG: divalent-cation tolerance protein CutA, partial [Nocardioides sp.]
LTMTGPDAETLASICRTLVDEQLIASANIVPAIRSIYRWQTEVHDEQEAYAVLQTTAARVGALFKRAAELHPYDTPHLLSVAVEEAEETYADWVIENVQAEEAPR